MFINVSNNLPTTSYMKMVDIWLLFNLILPFMVVLIHTYMDTLRNEEDREINHHGKSVSVEDNDDSIIKVKQTGSICFEAEVEFLIAWLVTQSFPQD